VAPHLRHAVAADLPAILALWRAVAVPSVTDTEGALRALLEHDPGALVVAEEPAAPGQPGQVVGTVVAGWDGWRGSVYRLAVAPSHRRRGLGVRLVRAAIDHLTRRGARRVQAFVVGDDEHAVAFWEATGWTYERGQRRYTRSVAPATPEGG